MDLFDFFGCDSESKPFGGKVFEKSVLVRRFDNADLVKILDAVHNRFIAGCLLLLAYKYAFSPLLQGVLLL